MTFEVGASGNPGGRTKNKLFTDALRRIALQPEGDSFSLPPEAKRLDRVALELVKEAVNGKNKIAAIKEIRDTLDGKPKETIAYAGGGVTEIDLNEVARRAAFILSMATLAPAQQLLLHSPANNEGEPTDID